MAVHRPYRRTCRQFADGRYEEGGRWQYVLHPKYAKSPEQFIRAFLLLQEDLQRLFQYVEPADTNLPCYSYRIHELLLRSCVEVEANCKAILTENGYQRAGDWNMTDYCAIERSHRLSSYRIRLPFWDGNESIRRPFAAWAGGGTHLEWYGAYNQVKHDRHSSFQRATFQNAIDAVAGLAVLVSAQFITHDFAPGPWLLALEGPHDGTESAIGGYFRVEFPKDWPQDERYDFRWQDLANEEDPFQQYPY